MSALPANASVEEIEDEISFESALFDSLGDDVSDDDERRQQIVSRLDALEARLEDAQNGGSNNTSPGDDGVATSASSVSGNTPSISLKRPGSFTDDGPRSKRPSPSRSISSLESISSQNFKASQNTAPARERARERQRKAEETARQRHERAQADARFAAHFASSQAGPSQTTPSANPHNVARIFRPPPNQAARANPSPVQHTTPGTPGLSGPLRTIQENHSPRPMARPSSQRQPIKPEPGYGGIGYPSLPSRPSLGGFSDVVDLTGDSSDETSPTAAPGQHNGFPAASSQQVAQRTPTQDASARNAAMQDARARYAVQVAAAQRAADERRRSAGHVYGTMAPPTTMDTAQSEAMQRHFDSVRDNELRRQAQQHRQMRRDEQTRRLIQQRGTQAGNDIWNAAQALARGVGSTAHSMGQDLAQLGQLISGQAGPSRLGAGDDEISYMGSRPLYDEASDPQEVLEDLKNLMDNIKPDDAIPVGEDDIEVPGMTIKLKPYQGTGLTWLQNMEEGSNKGGILADDMGLGKTVQAIALMVTRRSEDPTCKTTLILAPLALLRQWKQEIEDKIKRGNHSLNVFIHHSTKKAKTFKELKGYDVVLTTYGTIAAEYGKMERFEARKKVDPEASPRAEEKCLFIDQDSHWYRIIMDEAQSIKNKSTKTAKATYYLQAKSRFCMTGTPMMNSVDELYSLIHFLRIKPYNSWQRFSNDISRPIKSKADTSKERAMERLQALLKAILLRRHKKTEINGKPILQLPDRTVELTHPVFSEEERDFYKAVETGAQTRYQKYVRAGTVGRNYAHVLLMLLRLRQACCHPHLIKDFTVSAAADISPDTMLDLAKELTEDTVKRIKESEGVFECPVCYDAVENPAIFVPCGHDTCGDCLVKIVEQSNAAGRGEEGAGHSKCPNCRGEISTKKVIDWETFKKVYMPEEQEVVEEEVDQADVETESEADDDGSETDSDDSDDEEESDDEDATLGGFIVKDEADSEIESDAETESEDEIMDNVKREVKAESRPGEVSDISDAEDYVVKSSKGKGKMAEKIAKAKKSNKTRSKKRKSDRSDKGNGKGKEKAKKGAPKKTLAELKKLSTRNKKAKKEYLRRLRRDWAPSAKIEKTLELLDTIMKETDEKVIIFSQWTSLLDLLEVPIDDRAWGYERYDGSMTAGARADAVDMFKYSRRCRIMLVSLKAGNAGLNLNVASQVVILDPFWNPFIEEQAIDRAHRLGQMRPVQVHRLLIEETVEDRIVALQEQKRDMIGQALDEGGAQRAGRLSPQELAYLFGVSRNPNAQQVLPAAGGSS